MFSRFIFKFLLPVVGLIGPTLTSHGGLLAERVHLHFDGSGWILAWDSDPGLYYEVQQSSELNSWSTLRNGVLAEASRTHMEVQPRPHSPLFLRIRENGFVDPATSSGVQPNLVTPTGDYWVLEFSDEFTFFDASKWNKTVSTKSRQARPDKGISQWFWKEENVSVQGGNLVFTITKPNSNTLYCGSIDSRGLYEPLYGFMEARIRIAPTQHAIHTAFWTQGANMSNVDGSGADGAEVDIVETPWLDDRGQTVLHWDGYGADKKNKTNRWSAPGLHSGFHTFAMHWTESFIDIYYDGVHKWRYEGVGIPKVREWLWVSVGASFGDGDFQNGIYPSFAYVDYVRVWRSEGPNNPL